MASNSFGELFRFTTFGESHGPLIGVVVDGCPPLIEIKEEEINEALKRRAPGRSPYVSPRKEEDRVEIVSGVFKGKSTGAPITLLIQNKDADPSKYEPIKHLIRPGHANGAYLQKYGTFDYRGGGRASARETACRVAAGMIAQKILGEVDIKGRFLGDLNEVARMRGEGDSIGGIVEVIATGVPAGLGDPIYAKLNAYLSFALMSLPAIKGVEFDEGFKTATKRGSENRDPVGILGGISTGEPLVIRVAFKPTSSIKKAVPTVDLDGNAETLELPKGSRHDPCVAIRAVPVVEAMVACTLADRLLVKNSMMPYKKLDYAKTR